MVTVNISGDCIGCGTCVRTCPIDVIHQNIKTLRAFIKYPADCQGCHLCRMYCPINAITITPKKIFPAKVKDKKFGENSLLAKIRSLIVPRENYTAKSIRQWKSRILKNNHKN